MSERVCDYVIIGGGSAGCVIANRLSSDSGSEVVLLEAGGGGRHPSLRIPAGLKSAIFDDRFNWQYPALPDASLDGRGHTWSGGKGLGGSSSINGMLFIRGAPEDYDRWAALGCHGWDYASVLPCFRAIEDFEGGADGYRGEDGPLRVSFPSTVPEIVGDFIDAAQACGHNKNNDYNGADYEGVSLAQATIRGGRRESSASAFIEPVRHRKNLSIVTEARATRIIFDGKRAVGAEYLRGGERVTVRARKEVILCAGAIGSPNLLIHSGIGPGASLQELGIEIVSPSEAVGANLMEHPCIYVSARINTASFNRAARPWNIPWVLANWLLFGKGPAAVGTALAQVLSRSRQGIAAPDIQLLLTLVTFAFNEETGKPDLSREDGMSIACCALDPKSRGRVICNSPDPLAPPLVDHNLLGDPQDIEKLVEAAKSALSILEAAPLKQHVESLIFPLDARSAEHEWTDYLRASAFRGDHPTGTCRMGSDQDSVVDPDLRVRGVDGLRVADASIMPLIPRANTNAACMMIGEKAARLICAS